MLARYVLPRILQLVPLLWIVATVVFVLMRLIPGDPTVTMLGPEASDEDRAALRRNLGLEGPLHVQYFEYLSRLVRGDLGKSLFYGQDVLTLVIQTLPATIELALSAMIIAVTLAVPLGILASTRPGSRIDRTITGVAVLGTSIPSFWLGILAILAFSVVTGWLPSGGRGDEPWTLDELKHLALPSLTLAFGLLASTTRLTRSAMLEILRDDFIRTADAKGLAHRVILLRHALPNALIPVVTNLGLQLGALLGGAIVVEIVFAWPGIGRLGINAMLRRDYPLIQGVVLSGVALFALINLVIDLLYPVIDPRIRRT